MVAAATSMQPAASSMQPAAYWWQVQSVCNQYYTNENQYNRFNFLVFSNFGSDSSLILLYLGVEPTGASIPDCNNKG